MNSNENTIFGTIEEQPKNNQQKKSANNGWQQVTIGGVTGILMGAAGMYAANAFAGEQPAEGEQAAEGGATADATQSHTAENGLRVAEVDQNLSFGDAFAAARAEVGPGGVFHWHGGIYNTYTAAEWNSMSEGEHAQFALQVQPEIQPGEEHTGHREAKHDTAGNDHHSHKVDDDNHSNNVNKPTPPTGQADDDEPEVHFLGVDRMETENGTMNVGRMVIGDQEVALVDIDDNMVFDVAISDRNDNGKIDDNEVVDISEQQLSVTDFALAAAMQESGSDNAAQPEMANQTQQDQIAEDMPDYMNDADVQTI